MLNQLLGVEAEAEKEDKEEKEEEEDYKEELIQ